jgi:hypothetical protein
MPLHFFPRALAARREKRRADAQWAYHRSVVSSIGLITLIWGGIEVVIDNFFDWYDLQQGANRRRKIPQQTQEKVAYLQEIAADSRWTEQERSTIAHIADELDRLAVERRNFIHGHVFQDDPASVEWRIYRVKVEGGKLVRSFHDYHNDDIQRILKEVGDLSHQAAPFFGRIIGLPEFTQS